MQRFEEDASMSLKAIIVSISFAVFILDSFTALGLAEWVLYLLPTAMGMFLSRPIHAVGVTILACLLITAGFFTSPAGVDAQIAFINRGFGVATVVIVGIITYRSVVQKLSVKKQEWFHVGQVELNRQMSGDLEVKKLAESVVSYLAEYLNALAGMIYVQRDGTFELMGTYAVPADATAPKTIDKSNGLLGQAIRDNRTFHLKNVSTDYLRIGSALGNMLPKDVIIAPVSINGRVIGIIELAFPQSSYDSDTELLERLGPAIGVAIRSSQYLQRQKELLDETKRQSEELQAQSEELRVNNEELEEQGRALRESQSRLEQQQIELEETNSQLEEQATLLESQKSDLAKSAERLEVQKFELERSSQYKSEFLANMSHELRTPLNSSLILSKLLADNKEGNLTTDQVRYAQTIYSAGNDLLELINDILDLSKIESGKLETQIEPVYVNRILDNLQATFEAIAEQKKLQLNFASQSEYKQLRTDSQRLSQILRNLLSNALKFTDRGSVSLHVHDGAPGFLDFVVKDTGIGIPEDKQQVIFEAFRQADGTTNRRFGGTGLGLSISRELAKLLGGFITLRSEVNQGSTFTLSLPLDFANSGNKDKELYNSFPRHAANTPSASSEHTSLDSVKVDLPTVSTKIDDDRNEIQQSDLSILVIEDDESFLHILYDLAKERGFKCLLSMTASEGLALADKYQPSAIVLDVGLPDQSGLSVLDRLKHNTRCRHIPVHIVSANDYSETALSLGAVGYMLKPVKRDQLSHAFEDLRGRLTKEFKRVLVVEDDPTQLESVIALLGTPNVHVTGVRSAKECLQQLHSMTFDCLVLDLSLPDESGFELLETLSQEERYSFPPVIVYTGRDLAADEESELRRFSHSIIIKGARSPERLLDEVTLFLHQVVDQLPEKHQTMLRLSQNRESSFENRTVLIVEDDVRNVFALTSVLEPRGLKLMVARNGREALDLLDDANHPDVDLILMDLMMPEMDGLTAIREIRKRDAWRDIPIIALTAKAMRDDQQSCLDAGANDYMAKPLDVDRLLSLIRVWMPRRKLG